MPNGKCRLCDADAELRESHVIPAFVFRWMRDTSGGGYLRFAREPNIRVQDGAKYYWLCAMCEGRLNRLETQFANNIFHPYCGQRYRLRYGRWMLPFCVSLSWRVLRMYREETSFESWSPEAIARLDKAEQAWRDVLLGRRTHPGEFEQHFLPLDAIDSISRPSDLPPNINRYLLRAMDTDVCQSASMEFVYCKFGHFMLAGFVRCDRWDWWQGTKVHATDGLLEPKKYRLPHAMFEYILGRARHAIEVMDKLSPRQREKIEATLRANIDRFAESDLMKATQHDVRMFGEAAFTDPEQKGEA